jgi:hypothetical protein
MSRRRTQAEIECEENFAFYSNGDDLLSQDNHKEEKQMSIPQQSIAPVDPQQIMERVIAAGDLSRLSVADRNTYYMETCRSLGLNPVTRPFEYLNLNGRLVLYARKYCTEQLRRRDNVSLQIRAREKVGDCFVVTACARLLNGRADESLGVVAIAGLKGAELANAMMKAETKAKRRVTLSICGLGFLDESEVDDIQDDEKFTEDNLGFGDSPITMPQATSEQGQSAREPQQSNGTVSNDLPMTAGQIKVIRARMKAAALADADLCKRFQVDAIEQLKVTQANDVLQWTKDPTK